GGSPPEGVPVLPPSITVGGHMVHAVGLAWAARLRGEDRIALTSFGDGATSEGDFHEAMNFAAVYETPCVFLCQNNGYAISLPREAQTRSESIAIKADSYGMPGVQVDGNDLYAVVSAVSDARNRALSGGGPTLIEAITYRLGPHTTADDPRRYRADDEPNPWRERDPLVRVRRYLESVGAWDEEAERTAVEDASKTMDQAIEKAESIDATGPDHVFSGMFAELPENLAEQLRQAES
ncbi:MAG: pyruvate dehydrogenase (acetyl-transferring) E1 component subunit alpha, partial [Acidimicrobiia bacterium]|nr:pyruvate dehydrogenase (acetyl-transferring) E1 component subunit alpha [Acidimicrobiia bacterium]